MLWQQGVCLWALQRILHWTLWELGCFAFPCWEVALQRGAVAEWCQQGERAGRVFRVLHGPSLVSSGMCCLWECPGQGMALVSWCDRWVRVNHHQHTQREQAMFQKLRNYQNLTLKLAKWHPDNCIQKRFLMSLKLQDCCSWWTLNPSWICWIDPSLAWNWPRVTSGDTGGSLLWQDSRTAPPDWQTPPGRALPWEVSFCPLPWKKLSIF